MGTQGHSGNGPTSRLLDFVDSLYWRDLDDGVRNAARRHLVDTVGVMIAGAGGEVATRAEKTLTTVRSGGDYFVPGRHRRADLLDAVFLGATAAHGIELDDGYREGSVHPGTVVVPALLAVAQGRATSGTDLLEAVVAGYETVNSVARAAHPALRMRGFHPTAAVGPFGAAVATARLQRLSVQRLQCALGIAASASSGLFSFLGGGADIKRLHAGHAAREGVFAALLAQNDIEGPADVFEVRDGFMQAFAAGPDSAEKLLVPPQVPFSIGECYLKPYACCRHLQPAIEGLMHLMRTHGLSVEDIRSVDVETYSIAAKHADTGWDSFATAQMSFPFTMALAALHGGIELSHFSEAGLRDPRIDHFTNKLRVRATSDMDALYPHRRPARVEIETVSGEHHFHLAEEALGSSLIPLEDAPLQAKFLELTKPVLGAERASSLLERLWNIEAEADVRPVISEMAP